MIQRYWDSCCFVAWLAEEEGRAAACRGVLKQAETGNAKIVTSALTLTEVIKLKSHAPIPPEKAEMIRQFFENEWIVVSGVTRRIAERARQLAWDHGFDPKDSIHVATCEHHKIPLLDTFDDKLITKTQQIGDPPITIAHPHMDEQLDLTDASNG